MVSNESHIRISNSHIAPFAVPSTDLIAALVLSQVCKVHWFLKDEDYKNPCKYVLRAGVRGFVVA